MPTIYAPKQDQHSEARLAIVGELRRALDNDELVVHYQPEVEISTGKTPRVEALIRWNHPQRGPLEPDDFIPIAQHTGLILVQGFHLSVPTPPDELADWLRSPGTGAKHLRLVG